MRKLSLFLILLISFFVSFSQTPLPSGYPLTYSRMWVRYGYVQADSAMIIAVRDTSWSPRFIGSTVFWQRPGIDSTFWTFNGARWSQIVGASTPSADTSRIRVYSSLAQLRGAYPLDSTFNYRVITNNKIIGDFYFTADQSATDDSVMTFAVTGGRIKRFVEDEINAQWFGATGNGVTDDYAALQKAINYCIYNDTTNSLFIPVGTYKISKGLLAWKDVNNDGVPEFVRIKIRGQAVANSNTSQETIIYNTDTTSFGLAIQRGKGCVVQDIVFIGQNQLNYTLAQAWSESSTFISAGRSNLQSPYAGIVLDPFGSSTVGTDRYPDFTNYYAGVAGTGGSTACTFSNIRIDGYVVGIILSPNLNTQNNEAHVFDRIWLANCREGFATTQSQERQNTVTNFRIWDDVKTVFDSYTYGKNRGEPPNINGVNVAGTVFQIFNFQGTGGYFPVISINNVYAESFYRIGTVIGQNVGFFNSHFALAMTTPQGLKVQDWVLNTNGATFNNCMLLYYNGAYSCPLNIITGGVVKFTNCILSNQVSTYYTAWTDNIPEIQYENVRFYTRNGGIQGGSLVSAFSNYSSFSGSNLRFIDINDENVTYSYGMQYGGVSTYAYQIRKVKSSLRKSIPLGSVAVTVTGNTATATIPALAGKTQFEDLLVYDLLNTPTGGMQMMRINTIDGAGNVTFNYVTERVVTGTYVLWIEDLQSLATPYIFDYDGSTMTNVYRDFGSNPGPPALATLSTSTTYYYNNKPVLLSSVSAGSATPTAGWTPYNTTIKRGVLSNYSYEESGDSYGNPLTNSYFVPGVMFTEGAYYKNTKTTGIDSLVDGYRVVRSGIKNSTVPPEFEVVYRKGYAPSYTMLRNAPFISNGAVNNVQGNGGQIDQFVEDATDKTSSDDSAMVIVTTTGNRVKRITDGTINSLWFGAVPDDGVDDSWAFQKMFTYLDTSTTLKNYNVFIPGGKYQISGSVNLPASLYNAGSGSIPRLSIKGDGATIFVTGATTAWKRVVSTVADAYTAIDNYTLSISGIEFVGTQTTGQKGLELHSFYGADISNMRFTSLDTGFVARFILGSKFENVFYTNNKSVGLVGASLSGIASGATTSNSAFNANTITKNRFYCGSGSYAGVMLYAADGTNFSDNIIEGSKPRYSFFYDSEGASVVNGNSISHLWFESNGGTYTNNVALKLRVNGIFNIDHIQNDYADTLIDWSNTTAGAVITLDNVEYWNWPGKYIKGTPASGMLFKVGTVYGSVFENFFNAAYYNDGMPQDVTSFASYQLNAGAGIGANISSTEINVKPSFGQAYNLKNLKLHGNLLPDTTNAYSIGRAGAIYSSGYFQNAYVGKYSQYGMGEAISVASATNVGIGFRDGMWAISDSSATSKILLGGTVNLFTGMYYSTNNWRVDANGATYYASGDFRARFYNNGNLRIGASITDNGSVLQVDGTSWMNGKIKIFGQDSVSTATGGFVFRDYSTGELKLSSIPNNNLYARNTGTLGSGIFTLVNDSTFGFKKIYGINGVSVTESDSTVTLEVDAISDNTYTVSLTNVTNIASSSTNTTYYQEVGGIAHVWGTFTVAATSGSSVCELGFSLPVSTSITDEFQLAGTASSETGVSCFVAGDTVNSRAKIRFTPPNTTSTKYSFHFTYKIILP